MIIIEKNVNLEVDILNSFLYLCNNKKENIYDI